MWRMILLLCAFTLAACGAEQAAPVGALPTLAALPSPLPGDTPTPTVAEPPSQTPTDTPTVAPSLTETATVTPSATITDTPTSTPTPTATATERVGAVSLLALLAAQVTVLPPTYIPAVTITPAPDVASSATVPPAAVTCPYPPPGGFAFVFQADPTLSGQIGCPVGAPPAASQISSAYQTFERGAMTWLSGPIYALFSDGRFRRFDDTFVAGVDPDSGGENPPFPLVEPVRGFGKVWRSNSDVRAGLGWGLNAEAGGQAALQRFDRGWMVYLPQRGDILILIEDPGGQAGSWRSVPGQF